MLGLFVPEASAASRLEAIASGVFEHLRILLINHD